MKRFWDDVAVEPIGDLWQVTLDGKPMRLPGGNPLAIGSARLAQAVAAEWRAAGGAKGGETSFADLPLTRLAGTAQERVAPQAAAVADELARYGESDLLCYRAEHPDALVDRQQAEWQPWLDWAASRYGARLVPTAGVMHVPQDPAALAALRAAVARLPVPALAALSLVVPAAGSLVLGLALAEGALTAAALADAAMLDELFQEALWGADAEATARRARVRGEIALAERYLLLSRGA